MGQHHFVAKIEVAPAYDPDELTDDDLDMDHLEQIADLIAATGSTGDDELSESEPRQFKYELCVNCAHQYLKAPLGPARPGARLKYSQN
ncbi:hypothetical protein SH661x_002397 [Planctomicrobium sp. SH661]|uniref:hypothetical protein n=1 Tax=Planctomicrobium sp. SH661 TaxID=3448124 RepID=UPI003F5B8C2A